MSPPSDERPKVRERGRLRFDGIEMIGFPDSHCEAVVTLTDPDGRTIERTVSGSDTVEGRIRAAAEATLSAAVAAVDRPALRLELAGSKAVRAFDSSVVIVAIRAQIEGRRYRLTGCHATPPDEAPRGASLAALDAINRVLAPLL